MLIISSDKSMERKLSAASFKSVVLQISSKLTVLSNKFKSEESRLKRILDQEIIGDINPKTIFNHESGAEFLKSRYCSGLLDIMVDEIYNRFGSILRKEKPSSEDIEDLLTKETVNLTRMGLSPEDLIKKLDIISFSIVSADPSSESELNEFKTNSVDLFKALFEDNIDDVESESRRYARLNPGEDGNFARRCGSETKIIIEDVLTKISGSFSESGISNIVSLQPSHFTKT